MYAPLQVVPVVDDADSLTRATLTCSAAAPTSSGPVPSSGASTASGPSHTSSAASRRAGQRTLPEAIFDRVLIVVQFLQAHVFEDAPNVSVCQRSCCVSVCLCHALSVYVCVATCAAVLCAGWLPVAW